MNQIKWQNKAIKQLRKIQRQDAIAIKNVVETLQNFPDTNKVKALVNYKYPYRLRTGNYRIFFKYTANDEIKVITIKEVKKRNERTYR